jgi:hypothetical protein
LRILRRDGVPFASYAEVAQQVAHIKQQLVKERDRAGQERQRAERLTEQLRSMVLIRIFFNLFKTVHQRVNVLDFIEGVLLTSYNGRDIHAVGRREPWQSYRQQTEPLFLMF